MKRLHSTFPLRVMAFSAIAMSFFAPEPLQAAERVTRDIGRCVVNLALPRFGPVAESGGATGPVKALIQLGPGGKITNIAFKDGELGHHQEISGYLKMSEFAPSCAGKTVEILFSFRIDDRGSPNCRFMWINFRGPNHFVLTLLPRTQAIID